MNKWITLLTLLALSFSATALAADFPLRAKYPDVKPISTSDLNAQYDAILVVDVRSQIEYSVIHVNGAANIPVASASFLGDLEKLRPKGATKPIAFYCNGTTCAKSYKAAKQAMEAGFANVFCFDAGIPEWVETHPEKTTLMERTPAPKEKLIANSALDAHKIDFATFKAKAAEKGSMVIDIREPFQRAKNPELPQNRLLALPGVREIPLDRLVPLIKQKKFQDKHLLITDAVGKQVRWLQYYLEDNGYSNYAFLDKGVLAATEAGGVK